MNEQQILKGAAILERVGEQRQKLSDLRLAGDTALTIEVRIRGLRQSDRPLLEKTYLARTDAGALTGPALDVLQTEERKAKRELQALGRELAKLGLPKPDDCQ